MITGKFEFTEDLFWCQPTAFWDMPERIRTKLAGSQLCVVKGDANYRRLLGERQWDLDKKAEEVLSYWPVPVCALRTFKAEIGCGVSASEQQRAQAADGKWQVFKGILFHLSHLISLSLITLSYTLTQVSGRWGVVQVGGISSA
jgi:hypothetical protein